MKISPKATKGHLFVGSALVLIATAVMVVNLFSPSGLWGFLIYFSGVWGAVELGRYLESKLTKEAEKSVQDDN